MSVVQIHELDGVSADTWQSLRATPLAGQFFNHHLLKLWETTYGWKSLLLSCGNSHLLGFVKKSILGEMFYSLPFGWYGGVLSPEFNTDEAKRLYEVVASQSYCFASIVQTASDRNPTSWNPDRYQRRTVTTHIINVTQPTTFNENTQRNVERSRQSHFEIKLLAADRLSDFERLMMGHISRTGEKRRVRKSFYHALSVLAAEKSECVRIFVAYRDTEMRAGHIYLCSRDDFFYFDGFVTQEGLAERANFAILDYVISLARNEGALRLNLGASPRGDEGLVRFKEGWGATRLELSEYSLRSPLKTAVDRLRGR